MMDIATSTKKKRQLKKVLAEINAILSPWRTEHEQSSSIHIENNEE